jgi:hypothetical protein
MHYRLRLKTAFCIVWNLGFPVAERQGYFHPPPEPIACPRLS